MEYGAYYCAFRAFRIDLSPDIGAGGIGAYVDVANL
jgi:hypothetical protein